MTSSTLGKTRTAADRAKRRQSAGSRNLENNPARRPNQSKRAEVRRGGSQAKVRSTARSSRSRKDAAVQPIPQATAAESTRVEPGLRITLPLLFLMSGYLVGTGIVVLCTLDLLFGVPFYGANVAFDIGFLFSGAILLYMSWNARDACR